MTETLEQIEAEIGELQAIKERLALRNKLRFQVELMKHDGPSDDEILQRIITAACAVFNVSQQALLGRSRVQNLSDARACVCALARELTGLSLEAIGERIGGRNYGTVHCLVDRAQCLATDKYFAAKHSGVRDEMVKAKA